MGEIAEMMLDGTLCECCGTFIGDGDGYPRYCSAECAEGRGAASAKKKRRPKIRSREWDDVRAQMRAFAVEKNLGYTDGNHAHPHYIICRLRGVGVNLVVYPHTTKTTGNQHARIRNEGSPDQALAEKLIQETGLTVRMKS